MASSHFNTHSEGAKVEQIITEFFAKSLHIILESRSPYMSSRNYSGEQTVSSPSWSSSSPSSFRPRDKWFNLALRECPAALENFDFWRQNITEPMVVDVILVQRHLSAKERYPFSCNSDQEEFGSEAKTEKVIERWVLQYENKKFRDCGSGSRRTSNSLHTYYKKSILLLRSLYATVRLLPAYKIFRALNSSGQIQTFSLAHRVSSFVEPFTRKEDAEMQRFGFTPVDTSCGRLCLSVLYRSSVLDVSSESSTPISPQFIQDYVGSPLADPLKRLPSLSVSHGSPSSLPFSRRHSWSYDHYKASPPSVSFSPSPTHSDSHASISNPSSHRFPPASLPPHPRDTSQGPKRNANYDEYFPSPNFTPSPSQSPPVYTLGSYQSKVFLRSESAPVSIPNAKHANSRALFNKPNLPPSPPLRSTGSGASRTDKTMGLTQTGAIDKFSLGKDDARKSNGMKISSNSSPQISISRSSSRSFQDDFDDNDYPCPFDVEDDDITDPGSRPGSFDQNGQLYDQIDSGGLFPIRKSQDAAVGALVNMLKKAPPLRQDFSRSISLSQTSRPETCGNSIQAPNQEPETPSIQHTASASVLSSGLVASKTTADALEELRGYKEMRNLLVSQSSRSSTAAI